MKKLLLLIVFMISFATMAQISTYEKPMSFGYKLSVERFNDKDSYKKLSAIDVQKLLIEDKKEEILGIPPRFGYKKKVNYTLENSGKWVTLPTGDQLWRLHIHSPKALSINLLYNKFWIPKGGKLYIYSADKKHTIGAFTSDNNKGTEKNIQGFATGLVYSDEIVVEYYQPKEIKREAIISIEYVVHGYKYINIHNAAIGLGGSYSCNVNINCTEGSNWKKEKEAVALILVNGNRYCTGSLVKTTTQNFEPLLLTADHCLGSWANNYIKYDAITNPNLNHFSFYWHYEHPTCQNSSIEPTIYSTVGATVVANNQSTDFALLRLTEDPLHLQNVTPYYLGWDKSNNPALGGVGIHHPRGDVKKISVENDLLIDHPDIIYWGNGSQSLPYTHWEVLFDKGTYQSGSSGSAFINNQGKIVGQLEGGPNTVDKCHRIAYYGKFNVSWTGKGSSDNRRKLQPWLAPLGINKDTIGGSYPFAILGSEKVCGNTTYTVSNVSSQNNIVFTWQVSPNLQIVSSTNKSVTVEGTNGGSTGYIKAIKGDFELKKEVSVSGLMYPMSYKLVDWQTQQPVYDLCLHYNYVKAVPADNSYNVFEWEWRATGASIDYLSSDKSKVVIYVTNSSIFSLELRGRNECGWGQWGGNFGVSGTPCNGYYSMYPNPATGLVTLRLNEDIQKYSQNTHLSGHRLNYQIDIYNMYGFKVRSIVAEEREIQIPLQGFLPGVYAVHLIRDGKVYQKKLLVE